MVLTPEQCEPRVILKVLAGSHVHGLNVATSDRDEEAIIIEPLEAAWRLGMPFEECIRQSPELDVKYISLRKWVRLALGGNPNFLLPLFAPLPSILSSTSIGAQLREMRDKFISKQSIKAHLGYLNNQRNRMLKAESNDGRGKPRQDLTEQFGYDTKYAMHLLRLGLQGLELATTGKIILPLNETDRDWLLAVRGGAYTLEEVLDWASRIEDQMKAAFDTSALPEQPASDEVEAWMQRIYIANWSVDRSIAQLRDVEEWFPHLRSTNGGTNLGSQ